MNVHHKIIFCLLASALAGCSSSEEKVSSVTVAGAEQPMHDSGSIKLVDLNGFSTNVWYKYDFYQNLMKGEVTRKLNGSGCESAEFNFDISKRSQELLDADHYEGSANHVLANPSLVIIQSWKNSNCPDEKVQSELAVNALFDTLAIDGPLNRFSIYKVDFLKTFAPRSIATGTSTVVISPRAKTNIRLILNTETPSQLVGVGFSDIINTIQIHTAYTRPSDALAIRQTNDLLTEFGRFDNEAFNFFLNNNLDFDESHPRFGFKAAESYFLSLVNKASTERGSAK